MRFIKHVLILLFCISLVSQIPTVTAQNRDVIYFGGTTIIEPFGSYEFNWTWHCIDDGKNLTFSYSTGDLWHPLLCEVNNSDMIILDHYDYFLVKVWSPEQFPRTEETWYFSLKNLSNDSVEVELFLYYDMKNNLSIIDILMMNMIPIMIVLFIIAFSSVILYNYRKDNRNDQIQTEIKK